MAFNFNIMKKTLFITFLFMSIGLYSQGNLQFNRVINLSYTKDINSSGITNVASPTISENKVWKINSVSIYPENEIGTAYLYDNPPQNVIIEFGDIVVFQTPANEHSVKYPIWINSGQKELEIHASGTFSSTANRMKIMISAIEFNIVD